MAEVNGTVPADRELYEADVLVIGAGIFGSVIGAELTRIGRDVFYVDAERPMSGSRPAGCLMKPSWLSSMGKQAYEPALRTLDMLYDLETVVLRTRPLNRATEAYWIPPSKIMCHQVHKGFVSEVSHEHLGTGTQLKGAKPLAKLKLDTGWWNVRANLIVVATGAWTNKLFPHVGVTGRMGAAFVWENSHLESNFVSLWAPYKQIVGLNNWQPNTVWCGDGSAIIAKNFDQKRVGASAVRCAKATGLEIAKAKTLVGTRPYTDRSPCYLEEVLSDVWIATGGAKNGTVAAGYAARQISEAVC